MKLIQLLIRIQKKKIHSRHQLKLATFQLNMKTDLLCILLKVY